MSERLTAAPWTRWNPTGSWMHWQHGDEKGQRFTQRRGDKTDWSQHGTLTMDAKPGRQQPRLIGITSDDALAMANDRGYTLTKPPAALAAQEPGQ